MKKLTKQEKEQYLKEIVPIALEFREKQLNLKISEPISDTFKLVEGLGYFVLRFKAIGTLSGFHAIKGGVNCIFINSSHTLGRQFFSAWHEVYHAFSGDVGGYSKLGEEKYSSMEFKANSFANNVLMPEELIRYYVENRLYLPRGMKYVTHIQLIKMQHYFKVSHKALLYRLVDIYPEHYATFRNRMGISNEGRECDFQNKTLEANCDIKLIKPTEDIKISKDYYTFIHNNLSNDKITIERAREALSLLSENDGDPYD